MELPDFLTRTVTGDIHLTGYRIALYFVASMHFDGRTVEDIVDEYPTLPPEMVRQVVAFIDANREDVARYVEDWRREAARHEALHDRPEMKAKLRRRWAELYPGQPLPGER